MEADQRRRRGALWAAVVALLAAGAFGTAAAGTVTVATSKSSVAEPPAAAAVMAAAARGAGPASALQVCGRKALLSGPAHKPAGARTVSLSTKLPQLVDRAKAGTVFWLTPGVHTLGQGQFTQIVPKTGDRFIGAPGAVIDGGHDNLYAFGQDATQVYIEYLTIRNFGKAGDNNNEGVVNHDSGTAWHLLHDTITGNAGAGAMVGSRNVLRDNCLSNNGQYGFNAYSDSGPKSLTLDHNEIVGNDTYNWEAKDPGCGCTGGGKFWDVTGATVTDNYVHDNHSVGLWADTNNSGFTITGNYISGNSAEGLIYEISYNAVISGNTFVRNALAEGPTNPGFPSSAIYISESGGDTRVPGANSGELVIAHNRFVNNWSGVILWENADRFCNSPDNSSSGDCTLVNPKVANLKTCVQGTIATAPYFNDCRWKTQHVNVRHNTFSFDRASIGKKCTAANTCGLNGVFSNYGTDPSWSPYHGTVVEDHITFDQHNVFTDNTYVGPWTFMAHDQGTVLSFAKWRAKTYGQDAGSTLTK
jgi:Right handed beta helix region